MPQYDYTCQACGHTFTKVSSISDRKIPEESPCPNCNCLDSVSITINSAPFYAGGDKITVDGGFKERLSEIKKNHPLNNIKDYDRTL